MHQGVRSARGLAAAVPLLATVLAAGTSTPAAASDWRSKPVGTVVSATSLPPRLWIPTYTTKAFRLVYVSTDAHGQKALSSGELFIPKGAAPAGGFKVISWAHGTSGLADKCAPSVIGPAEPERDFPYLSKWMRQGYTIVATDYVGLGTAGPPAYLNGSSEAHNVVDMVKAGRAYAAAHLPSTQRLSNRWVTVGQSQGGGAAIYTARYATAFGGPGLRYLGAVGTGVPANIEDLITLVGPGVPEAPDPTGHVALYVILILASMDHAHPELGISGVLTPYGKKWVDLAESTYCALPLGDKMKNAIIGDFVNRPLATLPNWTATINDYMKMPESGFDKPFFMGHGILDTDVPFAVTAPYVLKLTANNQPLTFKAYAKDHSGTLVAAEADEIPFVAELFAADAAARPG